MRILLTTLFLIPFISIYAQTTNHNQATTQQVFVFKFNPGDDTFYNNIYTNGEEWQRLSGLIELHRPEIDRMGITLFVEGYSTSAPSQEENRQMAVTRSNRVKSMLIRDNGMIEDYFKTVNRTVAYKGASDAVVIMLNVPEKAVEPARIAVTDIPEIAIADVKPQIADIPVVEQLQPTTGVVPTVQQKEQAIAVENVQAKQEMAAKASVEASSKKGALREGVFSLRANLLYRLANMLNAGVEWKTSDSFGMLLNAGWSGTEWDNGDRKLRLWMVSPELRWYIGKNKRWFLGAEGHIGTFNIKLSGTGYQGNFMGGGLTAGYRARLSRYFDMDFSLGLGYIYTEYDEYYREGCESVQINEARIKKDIFGPTQVGVSLIWKLK